MANRNVQARSRVVRFVAMIVPLVLVAVGGVSLGGSAAAQNTTPTPGVLATPPVTLDCTTNGAAAPSTAGTPVAAAASFAIVSDQSEARYKAHEELAGRGANEAVGKTNAFIGHILFDANGIPLACSRFDIDLRTLKSDEARRDNYLYNNTLETQRYPLATFVLTAVEGLTKPLADGQSATFTLIGNLTIHGVTKLVAWQAAATLNGDTLKGNAATTFNMPDFAIEPPKVGPVISLNETVKLEVDITAQRSA